jgi:hypothetical protein
MEDHKQPVNPKGEQALRERLRKQFPPVDLDREACNTHECPLKERDESEF